MNDMKEVLKKAEKISVDLDGTIGSLFLGVPWLDIVGRPSFANKIYDLKMLSFLENLFFSITQVFRKSLPNSLETLQYLKKHQKIFLLTSRTDNVISSTERWLSDSGFEDVFTDKIFNVEGLAPKDFKEKEIRNRNIDMHIDNDVYTLKHLSEVFPDKIFICVNPFFDTESISHEDNVVIFKSWEELTI